MNKDVNGNNHIYLIINVNKMNKQAEFMKRIFRISAWLDKRYKLNSEEVLFNYGFVDDQYVNKKVTIKLTFK